jgi:3-oxoacyl-[acyl-carrier-protein] synthase-1
MTRTVAVTGFGILSPLGRGATETTAALLAGRSGIVSMRPAWAEAGLRSQVAGYVDAASLRENFERKQARFLCDAAVLAAEAMKDAIADAGLATKEVQDPRTGIILGTGAGASMPDAIALGDRLRERGGAKVGPYQVPLIMGSSLTANLSTIFHVRGHSYSVTSACSTSAHAALIGLDLIRSGRQDRVFVGGAEDVNFYSASAFDGMGALSTAHNDEPHRASRPLDKQRDGFVFAGGAAVLVLEELGIAQARGAKIRGILRGAGASCDGQDMVAPNGIGAEDAMRLALEDAGVARERIDYINLHGTSTPLGDLIEVEAIRNVFGPRVPTFSSTKSMTGHGLGAAGAQEAVFCLLMLQDGFIAPNINLDDPEPIIAELHVPRTAERKAIQIALSNSFGFGGTNCSLVFSRDTSR